ncbi:DUF4424 family protein [Microvirga guangxiensis]|uniref:DUF4424 domain-containing protein n=1 Tax=Microvirga guangxiensis TaxID=549386 RepID=A0A1G5JJR9_9HYPH|nr:DUF4424 family protein [Microvirga guangxiensis]SCY88632.1 protein of unknown function [Microvirga guangxiensis]
MRYLLTLAALASVSFWPGAVRANDTMAHFAAGELVFTQTDAVSMVSEDLFLSMNEVRVTYRFRNLTSQDVKGLVAFPMPEVGRTMSDADYPDGPEANPMRFSVSVDGQPSAVQFEAKAVLNGRDVTKTLRDLDIPIPPYSERVDSALKKLDRQAIDRLEREGLLETGDEMFPNWALAGAYHWQQTFPAGRDTIIQHRYKPSVGATVLSLDSMVRAKTAEEMYLVGENSCMDGDFIKGAKKWAARQLKSGGGSQRILDYILVTGANWAGPIGTFTLTVDKGHPDNLVSFCGEGVRKIAPTQFQMVKKNFTPKQNISVLILDTGF